MSARRIKLFFDGGCRPNPGVMEAAVVVRGATHFFDELGTGSSRDAEWMALLCALDLAQSAGLSDVELIGDSVEVITQANADLSSNHAPHPHGACFLALASKLRPARIRWIKREQNLAGIALASRRPR